MWRKVIVWTVPWFSIAVVPASSASDVGPNHASLRAYPEAILSARDAATGIAVRVDSDGRHVRALSQSDEPLWRTQVIDQGFACVAGSPVIRHLAIDAGRVTVTFCKSSYGEIDLKTGAYRFLGQD